jgi:hypothetical protein
MSGEGKSESESKKSSQSIMHHVVALTTIRGAGFEVHHGRLRIPDRRFRGSL